MIKRDLNAFVQWHLGFSAFTEIEEEKKRIRDLLVAWGYANYDTLLSEFMQKLPVRCVNTRLFRLEEAVAWRKKGGLIIQLVRPGFEAAEPKEALELRRCQAENLIDAVVSNNRSVAALETGLVQVMYAWGFGPVMKPEGFVANG